MAERCLICTETLGKTIRGAAHAVCLKRLFGTSHQPAIVLDPNNLYLFGQQMAGRVSISGVQSKVSLGWHQKTLRVRAEHSEFILKPQSRAFPQLPENEHVSLRLAGLSKVEVATHGLVRLSDESLALVSRRFDRAEGGRRIAMEDFCQLAGKLPRDKYDGSAELCARLVRQFSAEPGVDMLKLFRQILFSWWIGNGDLHLKNLSLLTSERGRPRLSPAYDLLSTSVVIPEDVLALPVGGKKSNLDRKHWLEFAAYCGLQARLVEREIDALRAACAKADEQLGAGFLRDDLRQRFRDVIAERTGSLA